MKRRKWTPEEIRILTLHYPKRGVKDTQRILARYGYHRTHKSIKHQASVRLLAYGQTKNLIPLTWVCDAKCTTRSEAKRAAMEAGALHETNAKPKYLVTEEWADQYASELAARADTRTWWTTERIAKRLNMREGSLQARLAPSARHKRLGRLFANVERRREVAGKRMRYHPEQAERACREYLRHHRNPLREAA